MSMRLDKYLSEQNMGTRSQVKEAIRKGLVTVNHAICVRPEEKVDEERDLICIRGERVAYQRFSYYMLNKPAGVVSATRDRRERTVLELVDAGGRELFPVGRLDRDTTGLLLLTDDGELAHRLLSPKSHVKKTYRVRLAQPLSEEAVRALERGVDIGDDKPTAPAEVEQPGSDEILLSLTEGRFHQVKRMMRAVDNRVLALERVRFGPLALDGELAPGEGRPLTPQEVALLHEA